MTISAELQSRYSSEVDIDWRDAFVLYHPSAGYRYLINHTEQFEGYAGSQLYLFEPVPCQIVPPSRDDTGRQDMSIVWGGIGQEALEFLNAAIVDGTQPILVSYSIFILGDPNPQIDPWIQFNLTNITVKEDSVTATATRADILNRAFPNQVYRTDWFPGLERR